MINLKTKIMGGLAGLTLLTNTGCEYDTTSDKPLPPPVTTEQQLESRFNDGHGRSHFYVGLGGHMFNGEIKEVTADVRPGATYHTTLFCSNDGDADLISVSADGNEICRYITAQNRLGGNGWYVDQRAACKPFTATSSNVVFRIVTGTDSWGTWPQGLEVSEVVKE